MPKILVIDDKKDNLIVASALLKNLISGCTTITAQSGIDGIKKAQTDLPDTILLDIKMPEMDGFEVCKRLKSGSATKHIPVLMLTAIKADTESRVQGLKLGADAFLSKPIEETELVAQINVMLRIKKVEDALRKERDILEKKTEEVEQTNIRLQEADRLKTLFMSSMNHELRTPLNSIIGYTGILLQEIPGELNDEQKRELKMISESADHLLGLINDFLDLNKINAGKTKIIPARFEVRPLVQVVEQMVLPLVEKKGLTLHTLISKDVPKGVCNDKNRIKQVLINLLSNAIKFTESGELRLEVKAKPSEIQFSVIDTGIGIKPEYLSDIFDEFKQIEGPLKIKPGGIGLGLSISKKMVELMGGRIRVQSDYGKGSCFQFAVPVKRNPVTDQPSPVQRGL